MRGLRKKAKQLQTEKEEIERRLANEIIEKDLRIDKLGAELQHSKELLSNIQSQCDDRLKFKDNELQSIEETCNNEKYALNRKVQECKKNWTRENIRKKNIQSKSRN